MMKPVHKAKLINSEGGVSPACAGKPRAISLARATWTNRWEAVTCKKCLAVKNAGVLIMIAEKGFYSVDAAPSPSSPSLYIQAADHGALNAHVIRVEDVDGNILWKRNHDA